MSWIICFGDSPIHCTVEKFDENSESIAREEYNDIKRYTPFVAFIHGEVVEEENKY